MQLETPEQKPVYYSIDSYEMGVTNTGSRSANYHAYCEVYDKDLNLLKDSPLRDRYSGRWAKCETVIRKWQRAFDKLKLQNKKAIPCNLKN